MTSALLIRIHPDQTLSWLGPSLTGPQAGAPPSAALAQADAVWVLVPSEAVTLVRAALPPGSPARLAQVLPWALEDQVLDQVEDLHFVAGPRDAEGCHAVAIVARAQMQAWLDMLAGHGIRADALLPDCLAVPMRNGTVTVVVEGGRGLVRTAPDQGFACELEQLPQWLADGDEPVALLTDTPGLAVPERSNWQARLMEPEFALLAQAPVGDMALNLLAGDFAARHRHAPQRRLWRVAVVLAVLAVAIGLLGRVSSVVRLAAANDRAEVRLQQDYARLFPDSPMVPDPVARVRSELTRLGGSAEGGGLLDTLARAAPILASHDTRMRLLGLEYRNNSLELSVRASDVGKLDQLRERLATLPGLRVELTAATPGEDGVDGRISLVGAGT